MLKAVDLRKGRTILHEGTLFVVHSVAHVAKGNKRSYMQTKLKRFQGGSMIEVRFSVDDRLEIPYVESKEYQFLYKDGSDYVVMDLESFDQFPISADIVAEASHWLIPNENISCQLYEGQIISLEIPHIVELKVTETTPTVKGATATNQLKDAILETGAKVRVPPFVEEGIRIRVDTRTGAYVERAK